MFKHTLATLPRSSLLLRCGRHHARSSQGKEGTRISPRHWVSTDCRSRSPRAYPGEYNRRAEAAEANISSIGARAVSSIGAQIASSPPKLDPNCVVTLANESEDMQLVVGTTLFRVDGFSIYLASSYDSAFD